MPVKTTTTRKAKHPTRSKSSHIETTFAMQIEAYRLPAPEREYRFKGDTNRRWRFDFAWPDIQLAVECEGGVYSGGRHTRGKGFENDCEKYNTATVHGWRVLRFTANMVTSGMVIQVVKQALLNEKL